MKNWIANFAPVTQLRVNEAKIKVCTFQVRQNNNDELEVRSKICIILMKRIHHYCHLYHSAEINQTETPSYVFLELFAKFSIAFSHQCRVYEWCKD